MASSGLLIGFGLGLLFIGLILLGFTIYYAVKKIKLTTGKKVLFWGGAGVGILVGLILTAIGLKQRRAGK